MDKRPYKHCKYIDPAGYMCTNPVLHTDPRPFTSEERLKAEYCKTHYSMSTPIYPEETPSQIIWRRINSSNL